MLVLFPGVLVVEESFSLNTTILLLWDSCEHEVSRSSCASELVPTCKSDLFHCRESSFPTAHTVYNKDIKIIVLFYVDIKVWRISFKWKCERHLEHYHWWVKLISIDASGYLLEIKQLPSARLTLAKLKFTSVRCSFSNSFNFIHFSYLWNVRNKTCFYYYYYFAENSTKWSSFQG